MLSTKKNHVTLCIVAGSLFLAGCWPFGQADKVQEQPKLVIINVLEKPEYQDCHIAGSINIPFDEFESKISSMSKQNYYVIYCADFMCMSSAFCAKLLKNAKFEHVWAYEGGMAEWYQKGLPYQGPAQLDYLASEAEDLSDDEDKEIAVLSAQELLEMMQQFGMQS